MFKEILKIEFSELENIIKNPSQFLQQEYNLDLSNNEIYFTFIAILLFIVGVSFEVFKTKKETKGSFGCLGKRALYKFRVTRED